MNAVRLAPVLKTIFIIVAYHILVGNLTLMAMFEENRVKLERSINVFMDVNVVETQYG